MSLKFVRLIALLLLISQSFLSTGWASSDSKPNPGVAILYFDYTGSDEQLTVLRKGIAEMLINSLKSQVDNLYFVERDRIENLFQELELSASDKVDQSTAAKVGKLVGAKYLVVGSFFDLMGTLRIDARMLEVETGEIIGTAGQNGKMDDFFGLQALLSDDLAKVMLARAANPVSTPKITTPTKRAASRPKITTATVVEYSKALDAKDRGDTAGAKQALERVVKSAPDFSLAVLDLNALVQ